MMRVAGLALLLLLLPGAKTWSKKHKIGVSLPQRWNLVKTDDGARAFVVEGPQLGDGSPHLVIWSLGSAGERTLKQWAENLDGKLRTRAGWKRTAMVDHTVGPWPAIRMGYGFQEEGKAKGRARVSVVLYGGSIVVFEMSGSARGFPAATFDRVEKSLEAKWETVALPDKAKAHVPPGWQVMPTPKGMRAAGPRGALVILQQGNQPPQGSKPEGTLLFLGEKRAVQTDTREFKGSAVQLRWVTHAGWEGVIIMPKDAWAEIGPGARAILARFELPPPRDGKSD
ncbi:MAG: hypothetical protein AAGD14_03285 [Planctomycetota bacterium]